MTPEKNFDSSVGQNEFSRPIWADFPSKPDLRVLLYERATNRREPWAWAPLSRLMHRLRWVAGCWVYDGPVRAGGYGAVQVEPPGRREQGAHRVVWELCRGAIPKGLMVIHGCDNPRCCNPDHLSLGTAADNARDMVERRRGALRPHRRMALLVAQ